eukprot:jgi/Psemu1/312117/fgenesh1_kg.886_\
MNERMGPIKLDSILHQYYNETSAQYHPPIHPNEGDKKVDRHGMILIRFDSIREAGGRWF